MIVLDTSVALAYFRAAEERHAEVAAWIESISDQLVTTPLAVAELDYFVLSTAGTAAVQQLYANLRAGAIRVEWWAGALNDSLAVAQRRPEIGLTDASLVALAARLRTIRIATLDERHFRALTPLTGEASFTLLPADAH